MSSTLSLVRLLCRMNFRDSWSLSYSTRLDQLPSFPAKNTYKVQPTSTISRSLYSTSAASAKATSSVILDIPKDSATSYGKARSTATITIKILYIPLLSLWAKLLTPCLYTRN